MNNKQLINRTRRSFLKKLGVVGAAPSVFNASLAAANLLWTRGALAQAGAAPKRLVTIHITNGAHPDSWHAVGTGSDFTLPMGSSPFAETAVKNHCVFLDGFNGRGGHGHHHQCVSNDKKTSLDIFAAQKIGADTPYSSLHLAAYPQGSLSRINGNGIPFELHPVKTYNRLFPVTAEGTDWKTIRRQSILGGQLQMLGEMKTSMNAVQRERLDLHAESIHAMSQRIQRAAAGTGDAACNRPFWDGLVSDNTLLDAESLSGQATALRTKLSFDLMVLAMKCDLTRVATFSFGNSGADVMLPFGYTWHDAQHGYNNAGKNPEGRKWFSEQIVYLIKALAAEPDVDGRTLLDNTLIYVTSDMGNGSAHDNLRHPIILAGGLVRGGQALDMGGVFWDPLFDTIAQAIGIFDTEGYDNYGNGAGPISSILV